MNQFEDIVGRVIYGERRSRPMPIECPYCEYDRKFPGTENGGWIYMGNNGPTLPCPLCNADERHPR